MADHERLYGRQFVPLMLDRNSLVVGNYYIGKSRNANVARWDGTKFVHWRLKFGQVFKENINHPEDEHVFDAFVPIAVVQDYQVKEIPLDDA